MCPAEIEHTSNAPSQHNTNSVVLLTGQSNDTPTSVPTIVNLNITKSSRVHIGPNIVSVTQNFQKTQVVKVRFLGLHFGSSKYTKRRFAVFACCAFIAVFSLAMFLVYIAVYKLPPRLDIGLRTSWYLRRADWQAMDPNKKEFLDLPLSHVIITHTGNHYCNYRYYCIALMLALQQDHLLRGFDDISPNFLVSGNGLVFEGRGANIMGPMVRYWSSRSIIIEFMGNYRLNETSQEQFDHINVLLDVLVKDGVLRPDYTLYGLCQVKGHTDSPGVGVILRLFKFPHWNSANLSNCLV